MNINVKRKEIRPGASTGNSSGECQLQLVMDRRSFEIIGTMKEKLDAASVNEVVRRALHVYHFYETEHFSADTDDPISLAQPLVKMHVRLPVKTKRLLDTFKEKERETYSTIISNALSVFAELIETRSDTEFRPACYSSNNIQETTLA